MTLSPLTTMVPSSLESPSEGISSDWSSSRFMCWSKPRRLPLMVFEPLSLISTVLLILSSNIFTAISTDIFYTYCDWLRSRILNIHWYNFQLYSVSQDLHSFAKFLTISARNFCPSFFVAPVGSPHTPFFAT